MTIISSIDGAARRVYLHADTVGSEVHPIDIYKEMRLFRKTDESLRGFDLFMKASGNESKGEGKFTERYVTLLDGTRIVPFDISHELTITGTIITDEGTGGIAVFDRTPLTATTVVDINYVPPQVEVIAVTSGSGLSVEQDGILKEVHGQIRREIFVDTSSLSPGDGFQQTPYNDLTAAVDDAETNGITALVILADISLDRALKNFLITGIGLPVISLGGFDLKGSKFSQCSLEGSFINNVIAEECVLLNGSFLNGYYQKCSMVGNSTCMANAVVIMEECLSGIAGLGRPSISMNGVGTVKLSVRGQKGGLDIHDCNQPSDEATIEMLPGSVTLKNTCIDGTIVVRGVGVLVDESNGSFIVDEIIHQLTLSETALIAKAVWDYAKASATVAGSMGEYVGKKLLTFTKFIGSK